jgi:aspartyl-tRNA(Asn)/glutamyl-tRNA(Gln) amidotransferase subunit A
LSLCTYSVSALARLLSGREISSYELTSACLDVIREKQGIYNAFCEVSETKALAMAAEIDKKRLTDGELPYLAGIPVAVKDNICTKGIRTSCGSDMLKSYIPEYDATAVKRLYDNGMVLIGKTNLDEFAMGSTCEKSVFGRTKNPHDITRSSGGSSGGSAAAVSLGMAPLALGSDTGGSVRVPASYCGVVGLKPSYGAVSRYGLVAFASSLDQIGLFGKTVGDTRLLAGAVYGRDPLDGTSAATDPRGTNDTATPDVSSLRIGYLGESLLTLSEDTLSVINRVLEVLGRAGAEIIKLKSEYYEFIPAVYYVISSAECASNLARYDGVKYGLSAWESGDFNTIITKTRIKGFGDEVKTRILLGNFFLSSENYRKYFEKACKARRLVTNEINEMLRNADYILSPVSDVTAPVLNSDNYVPHIANRHNLIANLAGLPAISIPAGIGKDGMPVGIQLMAKRFEDKSLLDAAEAVELILKGAER